MNGRKKVSRHYLFTEPLTPEECRTLLAHLPARGLHLERHVKEDENPVLYRALWKLEWQRDLDPER